MGSGNSGGGGGNRGGRISRLGNRLRGALGGRRRNR